MRIVKGHAIGSISLAVGVIAGTVALRGAAWATPMNNGLDTVRSVESDCAGIGKNERELGLMAYRASIAGTHPLHELTDLGKWKVTRESGSVVLFRAEPNTSAAWLRRVNACHNELVAEGQVAASGGTSDPFVVPGTMVSVDETETGFAVSVRASSGQGVAEVAHRLAGLSTSGQVATALNAR